MTAQLASGIKDRLESPNTGESITLIIGVDDVTSDAVIEQVESSGAEIHERLPYDSIAASIDEDDLDELCSLDVVTSVEIEGRWKQLSDQDFRFRMDTIL